MKQNDLMEAARVSEMTNINLSLHMLGRCIAALAQAAKRAKRDPGAAAAAIHVPYRDSKLTRLLGDALGGNATTRLIATLSPAADNVDETVSTLRFADRAKQVMVFVRRNEKRPVDYALVQRLQREVVQLRALVKELTEARGGAGGVSGSGGGGGDSGLGAIVARLEHELHTERESGATLRQENKRLLALLNDPHTGYYPPVSFVGSDAGTGAGPSMAGSSSSHPLSAGVPGGVPPRHPDHADREPPSPMRLPAVRGSGGCGSGSEQLARELHALEERNRFLEAAIGDVHGASERFFSFEASTIPACMRTIPATVRTIPATAIAHAQPSSSFLANCAQKECPPPRLSKARASPWSNLVLVRLFTASDRTSCVGCRSLTGGRAPPHGHPMSTPRFGSISVAD